MALPGQASARLDTAILEVLIGDAEAGRFRDPGVGVERLPSCRRMMLIAGIEATSGLIEPRDANDRSAAAVEWALVLQVARLAGQGHRVGQDVARPVRAVGGWCGRYRRRARRLDSSARRADDPIVIRQEAWSAVDQWSGLERRGNAAEREAAARVEERGLAIVDAVTAAPRLKHQAAPELYRRRSLRQIETLELHGLGVEVVEDGVSVISGEIGSSHQLLRRSSPMTRRIVGDFVRDRHRDRHQCRAVFDVVDRRDNIGVDSSPRFRSTVTRSSRACCSLFEP